MPKRTYYARMLEKAKMLVRNNRVEHLDDHRYNVIGDHGTYSVVVNKDGKTSCNCPGFRGRRRCSHSAALDIILSIQKRSSSVKD
jgi:hypothetical protein